MEHMFKFSFSLFHTGDCHHWVFLTPDYSLCMLFYFHIRGVQMKDDGMWKLGAGNMRHGWPRVKRAPFFCFFFFVISD